MIKEYINRINTRFKTGISREHSYRGDLQNLLEALCTDILVTNEPARIDCGAPDYILTRKDAPVGYIEAKDIGEDITHKKHKEQFDRYRSSLENLIITDYLDFWFYCEGEFVISIKIASIQNGQVVGNEEKYEEFTNLIKDFSRYEGQTIKGSKRLAEMMAAKAKMLAEVIENAIVTDLQKTDTEHETDNNTLREQLEAFKQVLIHDIEPKGFADIYAQTIAYGMFAARLHDATLDNFSRQEAAELIPKSNPFLRKLFQYIAGYDLDDRIKWIVDALADTFRATDVAALLQNFGKATQQNDPIIHFYETFLAKYDPKLRKTRGVWYTPQPVVSFIVRAVDDILKTEFNLKEGLADTSKTKIKVRTQSQDKRIKEGYKEIEEEVHKVQILDPAAGTGTFLSEVVKHVYKKFEGQQGIWENYVKDHLIPRLNGFELLMASYAMAHLKLELLFAETGCKEQNQQRLKVFLTNSLEEYDKNTGTLFASWLSAEANEANRIKRDTPVMCIIGNPPYSGESANKGEWIMNLMQDYKKEPGGKQKLQERNPKWINDDYVKFLRYGQHFIEKNGSGVLAFINPHGFLDNPTFRGMRWNLLKTYDKIYTIDLHGNSKKKEVCPDGSPDQNVFDIMQGVSINIFVKTGEKNADELGKVFHYDLFGKRDEKYKFLWENNIKSVPYAELPNLEPNYFFVRKDFEAENTYRKGFSVNDLFKINNVGIVTSRDNFVIDDNKQKLENRITDFFVLDKDQIKLRHNLKENKSWKIDEVKNKVTQFNSEDITTVSYRPFDDKFLYYNDCFIERSRKEVMQHFLNGENVGLVFSRQATDEKWTNIQVTSSMIDNRYHFSYKGIPNQAPLYLYPDTTRKININGELFDTGEPQIDANLNIKIAQEIAKKIERVYSPNPKNLFESGKDYKNLLNPIDILDYIYAVLHSPAYREKYKEFLKIDFPRVPYPKDKETFWQLVKLGGEIRQLHLLESETVEKYITAYPKSGDNVVTRKITKTSPGFELTYEENGTGKVWINDEQYFDKVPLTAWEFYIGGYQPAQKWLKDRHGRELNYDDILHYQKIIIALNETDRLMREIDLVGVE